MVTEIVNSDGSDVPPPQFTVIRIYPQEQSLSHFHDKV